MQPFPRVDDSKGYASFMSNGDDSQSVAFGHIYQHIRDQKAVFCALLKSDRIVHDANGT